MGAPVNQEINVNINALVKKIRDVREFVALIRSLREQRGSTPVIVDEKISQNARASVTEVDKLVASVQTLANAVDKLDEKQPGRLSQGLRTLSSIIQGLAAAGQALDFVKSWSAAFDRLRTKASSVSREIRKDLSFNNIEVGPPIRREVISGPIRAPSPGGLQVILALLSQSNGLASVQKDAAQAEESLGSLNSTAASVAVTLGRTAPSAVATFRGVITGILGPLAQAAGSVGVAGGAAAGAAVAVFALAAALAALLTGIGTLTASLVTLATIGLIPVLKLGLAYNSVIEQGKLGIASIIASLAEFRDAAGREVEGPRALNASLRLADEQIQKLKVDAINTIATFEQILPAFQSAIGPGLAAGLSLDEIRRITVQIVQAAGAIGLPAQQIAQEVRAILEGAITTDARLAKILGINNEMVKKWKEQGTLAEELNKRLAAFSDAGVLAATTLDGLTSNLQEALNVFTGQATERSFERLKVRIAAILNQIFDFKRAGLNKSFESLSALIDSLFVRAIDLSADFVERLINGAKSVASFVRDNQRTINSILSMVGNLFRVVAGITLELGRITGRLLSNQAILRLIQNSLIFTTGLLRLMGAHVIVLANIFSIVSTHIATVLNPLLTVTLKLASAIAGVFRRIFGSTTKAGSSADKNQANPAPEENLTFTVPKVPTAPGSKGAGGGAAPPDVSDSRFELERTRLEGLFNLEKDLLDRRLDQLRDHFDRSRSGFLTGFEERRLTIAQFYAEQERLQTAAVDKELQTLNRLRIERQKEFVDATNKVSREEKDPKTRNAQLAIEENKLQKDLVELDEKRLKLTRDREDITRKSREDEEIATETLKRQFDEIIDKMDALNGHTAKLEIGNILRSLNPVLEDLKKNFGETSTQAKLLQAKLLQEYIDLLINHAQVGEVLDRVPVLQDQFQIERLTIEQKVSEQIFTQREGRRALYELEQKYLELQLVELKNALALAQSEKDRLAIKLQIAEVEAKKAQQFIDETAASINGQLREGFVNFFSSIADGTKTIKQAFADLGTFILQMFARLAAQRLVESIFGNLLGDQQGQGGIGGVLAGVFGGKKAAGDMMSARPGGQLIQVAEAGYDELVVSTDPKYAARTSGLLGAFIRRTGILPDVEQFAAGGFARRIGASLSTTIPRLAAGAFVSAAAAGPEVALAGVGGNSGPSEFLIKQFNIYDPAHVHDAMRHDGGDAVFWNFIDHNATEIRQRLKVRS